jgi:dihydroorotase
MSTTRPAQILKRDQEIGTLRVGTVADIAVLERLTGRFVLTDSYRQDRTASELLVAATTVRRGEIVPGGGGRRMARRPD